MPVNRFDAERTATGYASRELSIQSRQRDCNEAEAKKKPAGVFGAVVQPLPPILGHEGTGGRVQCSGIKSRLAIRIVAATKKPAGQAGAARRAN